MERERAAKESLVVRGNHARLKKLMRQAQAGKDIHIGFLGGSITQGSLASTPENCYAARVFRWWETMFPNSRFSYINAGIGGTTSLYGAARAWMDVMRYRPDFVMIDFTVNDEAAPFFQESFEGVVCQLYRSGAAVMILNNICYDTGVNAQDYHNPVAEHYQIPAVSMREGLYAMIQDGTFDVSEVAPDNLHPNDLGHELLAEMITYQLKQILESKEDGEEPAYPAPLTANRFEQAKRWQITDCDPKLCGFLTDPRERTAMLDLYKNGWTAKNVGDSFLLELECSHISVQYLRSVNKPRPVVEAVVDGDTSRAVRLDGNFDEDWGDCLALTEVFNGTQRGRHEIRLTVTETPENAAGPFYLVSIITD